MGEKAVAAAKAVNYSEVLSNFWWISTVISISRNEHPFASGTSHYGRSGGVDLVKEQIMIASGYPLHLKQEDLFQRGHAIECRICAEDTENNFMPSPGNH